MILTMQIHPQETVRSKIYKSVTPRSIMDVTAALDHFQHKNGEELYKGKIVFAITVMGQSSQYSKAYVNKKDIKPMLHLLINHKFPQFYKDTGFESYGGSMKDGKPQSRVFRIKYTDRKQFNFIIEEGEGQKTQIGGFKMTKRQSMVETFLSYEEALKMAHELYDYIHQAELAAMLRGKPLYTVMASH
ncbi:hypothetical protein CR203_23420 [Salipaludibacillus neizhouensis]|uniref:Uncharacterized protein n=1 Tax=Salipaludibacillus neizhouensis TaxID=885475 RepID=A0A3A9K3T9_9BACI|nr:hypothetical protein [Salipaludibacillus neizhouensis]RKL64961.1 hypothetical protein CR203_23420 [Salipaludibacillus neizhouensis]